MILAEFFGIHIISNLHCMGDTVGHATMTRFIELHLWEHGAPCKCEISIKLEVYFNTSGH
jgi:hypothetical protein